MNILGSQTNKQQQQQHAEGKGFCGNFSKHDPIYPSFFSFLFLEVECKFLVFLAAMKKGNAKYFPEI